MENEVIIKDFKEWLEACKVKENEITYKDVNEYLMYMYYEIFDNTDSIEDRELIEEHIEHVICENFEIIINN